MSSNPSNASFSSLSSKTVIDHLKRCWKSGVGVLSVTFLTVTNVLLLLPLCIFVLHLGLKRWRRRRRTAWRHSDIFTFHMVAVELFNIGGSVCCCVGVHLSVSEVESAGIYLLSVVFTGQMLLHALTCGERYLAVVHPVTYVGLRGARGVRIRNAVLACVWLLSFASMGSLSVKDHAVITYLCFALVPPVLVNIAFCSISVLVALIRSGPGEKSRSQQQVDQSKRRAFFTITLILTLLMMRFIVSICLNATFDLLQMEKDEECGVWLSEFWFCLPISLVLPLLFLHRAGKLPCCRSSENSAHPSH